MLIRIIKSYRNIVSICDTKLLGKIFEKGKFQLNVKESFFKGEEKEPEQITKIMKDIDIDDAPILACALAIKNIGIWSEDKHFEKQNKIKVWKTKDILKLI